jgi:hypothetical protein
MVVIKNKSNSKVVKAKVTDEVGAFSTSGDLFFCVNEGVLKNLPF